MSLCQLHHHYIREIPITLNFIPSELWKFIFCIYYHHYLPMALGCLLYRNIYGYRNPYVDMFCWLSLLFASSISVYPNSSHISRYVFPVLHVVLRGSYYSIHGVNPHFAVWNSWWHPWRLGADHPLTVTLLGGGVVAPPLWSWVIKCPHVSHHPTTRYLVYNGYFFRWCPIYPKWDSYQPLLNMLVDWMLVKLAMMGENTPWP